MFSGTKGSITITHNVTDLVGSLNTSSWSTDAAMTTGEATPFSPTKNARTVVPGISSYSGQASGFLDDTASFDVTKTFDDPYTYGVAVVMTATTGRTYTGAGFITGFHAETAPGEAPTWSCTFELNTWVPA